MIQPIICSRGLLRHWNEKMLDGRVTIGFLGGSITDARPRTNWPEPVMEWLITEYPMVRFRFENAAIGATGSDLAALRVQRDIIDRACDVVFIEYAVNDEGIEYERRGRTREGLVRQLKRAGIKEIIFIYTFSESLKEELEQGSCPNSIAQLEQLASYYDIPSIWVGRHGYEEVKRGRLSYDQWLRDGLHPTVLGSLIYGECIIGFLKQQLLLQEACVEQHNFRGLSQFISDKTCDEVAEASVVSLPPAIYSLCWEQVEHIPFTSITATGSWSESRWHSYEWVDIMLETKQLGATLSFSFQGRGLMLVFDYGSRSAEFIYRIDGGEWLSSGRDCPDWVGEDGWLRLYDCGESFSAGIHQFELQVVSPEGGDNCHQQLYFRLGKVGVIR